MNRAVSSPLTFRQDLADFWRFLRHPDLRRSPGRRAGSSLTSDWRPGVSFGRLLAWAALLWAINAVLFGPLSLMVAQKLGAEHRLDAEHVPVLIAVLWAPVVEELLFRYGMRRPAQAWWMVPLAIVLVSHPLSPVGWIMLVAVLLMACRPLRRGRISRGHWARGWRREYVRAYGLVYHGVALVFAAVHLHNFFFDKTTLWLLPFLVLPQWVTGLVLGWMRTRRGIGASMALHSLFNAGPVLIILLTLHFFPGSA
ncbi:MAG TPA: CPBP family glutamic-type intramembrane protease [Bordetella sp.]|uniref:CPBP family glutamic-type intramembrane protease n=1 Tax=Bordetella sp. TaxID=28081 RepID=UPI002ED68281